MNGSYYRGTDWATPKSSVEEFTIEGTVPSRYGIETMDVGMDLMSPVGKGYESFYEFTGGHIDKVAIDLCPAITTANGPVSSDNCDP